MFTPDLDHRSSRFETLVEYTHSTISKPSNEDISRYLIRCQ